MASKTSVNIAGETMKSTIAVPSPSTTLYTILSEFCKTWNVNQDNYMLSYKKKPLDLSLPWRLAGLPNNCTLDLERAKKSQKGGVGTVSLAIQIDQNRYVGNYPLKMTFWDVLLSCEKANNVNITRVSKVDKKAKKEFYQQIVVSIMNNALKSLDVLQSKTLVELGLRNGDNVLARLTFENSDKSLAEMLPVLDQYKMKSDDEFLPTPKANNAPTPAKQAEASFNNNSAAPAQQQDKAAAAAVEDIVMQDDNNAAPIVQQKAVSYLPIDDEFAKEVKLYKLANVQFDKSEILDIPEAEFELKPAELRSLLASQERKKQEGDMLRTSKMREVESQKKKKTYAKCLVRFRYPSGLIIQASFAPSCTISNLYNFVGKTIENSANCPFYMYVAPPIKRLDDEKQKTLIEMDYVPAVIINVALDKKKAKDGDFEPVIKSEFLPLLTDMEKEALPAAIGSSNVSAAADKEDLQKAKKEFSQKVLGEPSAASQADEDSKKQHQPKNAPSSGVPKWFKKQ